MKHMELLAPAGGMEQLAAAVRFGADAVYGGMKRYGLRAFAGNFDERELASAVALCHAQGVRFYVTMNVLPRDEDMAGFLQAARFAADAGVDAAIVSDLGAAKLLRDELPQLSLHISTQMNVLNSRTAALVHELTPASRVVLARELTLEQITRMRQTLPPELELECFVHGAMCMAYSGRCIMSAVMAARSGNRGECAQSCRWHYEVVEEKRPGEYMPVLEDESGSYLFSSYDLCMLPHLPALGRAGVASLKIEGRMKTAYYVASVVSVYRRALDLLETLGDEAFEARVSELMGELQKASHRKSNTGFYFGQPEPPGGANGFEQSLRYVGDIASDAAAGEPALVRLKNRIALGDALEVLTPEGAKAFPLTEMRLKETGESVAVATVAGTELWLRLPCDAHAGDFLRGPY